MLVAPNELRGFFESMIQRETQNAKDGLPCGITAKVNSLVDPEIISLLYKASQAGVPIHLIVRGICCLIPGLPGISEHIEVISSSTVGFFVLKTAAPQRFTWGVLTG